MAICCNKVWGIGINIEENGEAGNYGRTENSNPHLFYPDHECCTPPEIENWEKAKEDWENENI